MTREEGGGNWTIDASGKTTYNSKDYGSKYHIKEDPTGALRRGDGWISGAASTADRLVWTFKSKSDVVWIRRNYLQLCQGVCMWHLLLSFRNHLFCSFCLYRSTLADYVVVGSWVTHEEGGGDWTIDVSGKTTYDNKDYGPKYHITEDPTGVLRRGDGWVSGPESTTNRLVWTLEGKSGELLTLVWTRQNVLKLQQGQCMSIFNMFTSIVASIWVVLPIPTSNKLMIPDPVILINCAVVGFWVTNEAGGGDWTIDASGQTTLDDEDYGSKYYIKEDPSGVLRRGDGLVSGAESTPNRLVWTLKSSKDVIIVWTRRNRLELEQGWCIYTNHIPFSCVFPAVL